MKSLGLQLYFYMAAPLIISIALAQVKARDLTILSFPQGSKSIRAGGDFHLHF